MTLLAEPCGKLRQVEARCPHLTTASPQGKSYGGPFASERWLDIRCDTLPQLPVLVLLLLPECADLDRCLGCS